VDVFYLKHGVCAFAFYGAQTYQISRVRRVLTHSSLKSNLQFDHRISHMTMYGKCGNRLADFNSSWDLF